MGAGKSELHLIGFAFGLGGVDPASGEGPKALEQSSYLLELIKLGITPRWEAMIGLVNTDSSIREDEVIRNVCLDLAIKSSCLARERKFFTVIGGDHTCAIGTWSGVHDALHDQGDIGLIWIDAHMDSHTPETTETGRIHGMPLACLLGYGFPSLTGILSYHPKLKPENICLIGVRSYERGEADFLKKLNVRTYFMDEVKKRGFTTVLREAISQLNQRTIGYGISMDLDSIDPHDAPGVDVPEPNGIAAEDFCEGIAQFASDPKLIATEIVEFDPSRDQNQKTEKLIVRLLEILGKGKC